jgi:hypothetical protein
LNKDNVFIPCLLIGIMEEARLRLVSRIYFFPLSCSPDSIDTDAVYKAELFSERNEFNHLKGVDLSNRFSNDSFLSKDDLFNGKKLKKIVCCSDELDYIELMHLIKQNEDVGRIFAFPSNLKEVRYYDFKSREYQVIKQCLVSANKLIAPRILGSNDIDRFKFASMAFENYSLNGALSALN